MKVIIASDKFKGTLTSVEVCDILARAFSEVFPRCSIDKIPLADGGEGTVDTLMGVLEGDKIKLEVSGPLGNRVIAEYGIIEETKTAIIEMASASGLKHVVPNRFSALNSSTYGVGELIVDAMKRGCSKIILCLGGSATTDAGVGMALALGYKFLNRNNGDVPAGGKFLKDIVTIDDSEVFKGLSNVDFVIASDVLNPLYGAEGAASVYAGQKGASSSDIELLDEGLKSFAEILKIYKGKDVGQVKGAGAAGGLGAGGLVFLNSTMQSGIEMVLNEVNFVRKVKNADLIITGEGRFDKQSLQGKVVNGVLEKGKLLNIPVALICGISEFSASQIRNLGIANFVNIVEREDDIEYAMINASTLLYKAGVELAQALI